MVYFEFHQSSENALCVCGDIHVFFNFSFNLNDLLPIFYDINPVFTIFLVSNISRITEYIIANCLTNNQDFDNTNLLIILIISEIKKKFAEALHYAPKR